jgi:hypothetical protein
MKDLHGGEYDVGLIFNAREGDRGDHHDHEVKGLKSEDFVSK